jgi:hypothetical protein
VHWPIGARQPGVDRDVTEVRIPRLGRSSGLIDLFG